VGKITFKAAPNASGVSAVSVTLKDSGGTIPAKFVPITNEIGRDESDVQVFTIELKPKNDAPYFQMQETIEVGANTGFMTFDHFSYNVMAGPADEATQNLTFVLTAVVDAGTLFPPEFFFSELPTMDMDGTLTFAPAPRVSGTVLFTFTLFDSGGIGVGQSNSFSRSARLSVESVNNAPSFNLPVHMIQVASIAYPLTYHEKVVTNISKGATDEDFTQEITFVVQQVSNVALFLQLPTFEADGKILFVVSPGSQGNSTVRFFMTDDGGVERGGGDTSEMAELTIEIVKTNVAPAFNLVADTVMVVEDTGLFTKSGFVHNISKGTPDEANQTLFFNITLMSVTPNLFEIEPFVDDQGTLSFHTGQGAYGSATASIKLTDSGGTDYGGIDETGVQTFRIQVHPRPKIISVHPALGPSHGGIVLTVKGSNLSPQNCRRGTECPGIQIEIGGLACPVEGAVSPEQITCRTPPGLGRLGLYLNVLDDSMNRSTAVPDALVQHDVLFGGLTTETNEGYVAYGFGGGDGTRQPSAFVFEEFHPLSAKGVRAIAAYKSKTYVAGGFLQTKGSSANHIAAFDGTAVSPLGSGVDGLVNALVVFNGMLIVGGGFTKVIKQPSKRLAWFSTGVMRSGGLASWNGSEWGMLGSQPLLGIITSLNINGSILYVGGRFNEEGRKNNLAMFNGATWSSVCGLPLAGRDGCGVSGGEVLAMATFGEDLYVGGTFVRAGGVPASRIARWDGAQWFPMSSGFDGDVHALAILDGTVYAAGVFGGRADSAFSYLAHFRLGAWQSLQGGVGGPVFTLLALDSCLYIGGAFDSAGGMGEILGVGVRNVARWCFDRAGRRASSWSAIQMPRDDIGVCRAIKPSEKLS